MFHCRLKIKVLILVSFILKVHVCMHVLPKQRSRCIRTTEQWQATLIMRSWRLWLDGETVTCQQRMEGDVVCEFITMSTRCFTAAADVHWGWFILCGPWLAPPPSVSRWAGDLQVTSRCVTDRKTVPLIWCLNMQMRPYLIKYVLIFIKHFCFEKVKITFDRQKCVTALNQ